VPVAGIPIERQVGDNLFPGTQIETEAGVTPVGVEGLLVEAGGRQRLEYEGMASK